MKRFANWVWLVLAVFSVVLLVDGIWLIAIQLDDPFFPYQLGRLVRIGIAVCIGLVAWYLKGGRYAHRTNR